VPIEAPMARRAVGVYVLRVAAEMKSTGRVGSEGEAKLASRLRRAEVVAMVRDSSRPSVQVGVNGAGDRGAITVAKA
jgi:hypothetical protein